MKKLLLLLVLVTSGLVACETDVYDKGEGDYSLVRADFAVAHVNADKAIDYIVTDDDTRLPLSVPYQAKWLTTANVSVRVLAYYRALPTQAEAVRMSQVSVAKIQHRAELKKEAKADPVKLESMWLSHNRQYLNAGIILMMGSGDDDEAYHHLGILRDTTITYPDGRSTLCLSLLHDQGGVPEYYSYSTYFSIPVASITADSVRLTVNTYTVPVSKTFYVGK